MPCANNKGADQPSPSAQSDQAFVVRCLDSIIPLLAIAEISRLLLVSVAEQAGLSLNWPQTPKTGFLVTRYIFSFRFHLIVSEYDALKISEKLYCGIKKHCQTFQKLMGRGVFVCVFVCFVVVVFFVVVFWLVKNS